LIASFVGFLGAAAAAPLPRGERGVANGKEKMRKIVVFFAYQKKQRSVRTFLLEVREGRALSNWRGSAETGQRSAVNRRRAKPPLWNTGRGVMLCA
jgi:hypothetical protein